MLTLYFMGAGGRRFESCRPDKLNQKPIVSQILMIGFFHYVSFRFVLIFLK